MKKNIIVLLMISTLLLLISIFLIYMTKHYKQTKMCNSKISQEYILEIEKGDNLIDKKLLLTSWKAYNKYVDASTELSISYANALEKTYFGLIF